MLPFTSTTVVPTSLFLLVDFPPLLFTFGEAGSDGSCDVVSTAGWKVRRLLLLCDREVPFTTSSFPTSAASVAAGSAHPLPVMESPKAAKGEP